MPKRDTVAKTLYQHLKSLNQKQKNEFIEEIISDPEFFEDLRDILLIETRKDEPTRLYEDFKKEYEQEILIGSK